MVVIDQDEGSPGYHSAVLLGYAGNNKPPIDPVWFAAGYTPKQMCRYYCVTTGEHMIYRYLTDAELPGMLPDRIREDCEYFSWDFE